MHDRQLILQEPQTLDHTLGDPRQHVLWYAVAVHPIQTSGIHVLHTVVDTGLDRESAVEFNNLGCYGAMENVEFHNDTVEFRFVELEPDFL